MNEDEDEERFTVLYDEYRMRVWAYAVSRVGSQLADEVVSETFMVAWRRFADMPAAALPWLIGVARNVIRDSVRARTRWESLAEELRTWAVAATSDVADEVVDRATVLRALGALTEADREILTLVAWQGLSARDVARVVGCSATTLRVRLHRARKRLAEALDAPSPVHPRHPIEALEWS